MTLGERCKQRWYSSYLCLFKLLLCVSLFFSVFYKFTVTVRKIYRRKGKKTEWKQNSLITEAEDSTERKEEFHLAISILPEVPLQSNEVNNPTQIRCCFSWPQGRHNTMPSWPPLQLHYWDALVRCPEQRRQWPSPLCTRQTLSGARGSRCAPHLKQNAR